MRRTYNHRNRSNTSRNKTYSTTLQQQQEQQHIRSVSCHTAELLPSSAQDLAVTVDPRPFADDDHRRRHHIRPPPPRVVAAATTAVSTSILQNTLLAVLNQQAREDALCFLTNLDKSKKEKDTVDQAAIDDVMRLWSTEHRVVDDEATNVFGDHTELQIFPALL